MEEAGKARGGPEPDFVDFGSILGFCFDVFWALRLEISISFRARFQVTYCTDLLGRNLDAWGS